MKRFFIPTIVVAMFILLPSIALALSDSMPGESLESAMKKDFFTFFHFKKKPDVEVKKGSKIHHFTTKLGSSPSEILLAVDTDKSDKILQMNMSVNRQLIDNPRTRVFIQDIVKSFILAATPSEDADKVSDLVKEIFYRRPGQTVLMAGSPPTLPKKESDGYAAFHGSIPSYEKQLGHAKLVMKNRNLSPGKLLEIRVDVNGVK